MPLSWNEIRTRSIAFSKEWKDETSERAEAKSFWDGFFNVFGVTRRRLATFEEPVKKSDGKGGFIDLLWKGTLLVEHKSEGKDLDRAVHQATSLKTDADRVAFLFELYQKQAAPLDVKAAATKKATPRKAAKARVAG